MNEEVKNASEKEVREMLSFLLSELQSYSIQMNGQHSYRLRTGWPMTHAKGPTPFQTIANAIKEVKTKD